MSVSSSATTASAATGLSMAGKLFFGSLCGGTFGLGVWQTTRYFEKQQMVQRRQAQLAASPVHVHGRAQIVQHYQQQNSFQRLQIQGQFAHEREFLVGPRGPPAQVLPDGPGTSAAGLSAAPQGYYVITPFYLSSPSNDDNKNSNDNNDKKDNVILVNRGWVPRSHVQGDDENRRRRRPLQREPPPKQQHQHRHADNNNNNNKLVNQWDRPKDPAICLTVVSSSFEQPKSFLIAQHEWTTQPPRLFWYDQEAMMQIVHNNNNNNRKRVATNMTTRNKNDDHHHPGNGNGDKPPPPPTQQQDEQSSLLSVPYVTVVTNDPVGHSHLYDSKQKQQPQVVGRGAGAPNATVAWPLPARADKVGDFRVTPAVHAGYAVTWYSLAAAGLYMTRLLATKRG